MSFLRQHFPFVATILAMMVVLAIGGHYARGVLDHEQQLRKAALRAKEDAAWSQWSSSSRRSSRSSPGEPAQAGSVAKPQPGSPAATRPEASVAQ